MSSTENQGLSDRIRNTDPVRSDLLTCPLCLDILWKPIACEKCKKSFCSTCIRKALATNQNKCPYRCDFKEDKCERAIITLLSELKIACCYHPNGCDEVIPYEALEKHEIECGFQKQKCPGCHSKILKKDFANHEDTCGFIKLNCNDCKLVYKRSNTAEEHTEIICLKRQARQDRDKIKQLIEQVNELKTCLTMDDEAVITFDDVSDGKEQKGVISNTYKGVQWENIEYRHESYIKKTHRKSGYATSFTPNGSKYVVRFLRVASIHTIDPNKTFSLVWIQACAAWKDNVELTIRGHRRGRRIEKCETLLPYGKPKQIILLWNNIDKVTFSSSGGTVVSDTDDGKNHHAGTNVVITALKMKLNDEH